jgi:hypothetical protein
MGWLVIVIIANAILFGVLCGVLANMKGQSGVYAFMGIFFSLVGLVFVAGLPDLKSRTSSEVLSELKRMEGSIDSIKSQVTGLKSENASEVVYNDELPSL